MSRSFRSPKLTLLLLLLGLAASCGAQNQITILNDAFGKKAALEPDWGYAALIEFEGKRILFDTGDNVALFQRNIEQMHVDLSRLDMVIISHAHGDHTSGLRYVLSLNPHVPLFVPDDPYFTGRPLPSAFLATDVRTDLPPEMRYFDGKAPVANSWQAWTDTKMTVVRGPLVIAPHVRLVALVSDKPGFVGLHEVSLVLNTPKGKVVIVGCSHPGIEKIMAAAAGAEASSQVYMLFGGLHLLEDTREQITATMHALADQYGVQKLAIGHCTGELAFLMLQQKWAKSYEYAGLGETLPF